MKKRIVDLIMVGLLSASVVCGCSVVMQETGAAQKDNKTAQETARETEESTQTDSVEAAGKAVYTSMTGNSASTTEGVNVDLKGDYSEKALEEDYDEDDAKAVISLKGSSIEIEGDGAAADGSVLTITEKGTYILSGSLENGTIIIDNENDENIRLVLKGVDITSDETCCIFAKNAKNLYITLAEGTENNISDSRSVSDTDSDSEDNDETTETNSDSAIYSAVDLIINGEGILNLVASNDGIKTKDDLQIISGSINIKAGDDGMIGKDSVQIRDGSINIECADDCIKSSKDDDPEKGYVVIDGGDITLSSDEGHGIQAVYVFVMNDGKLTVKTSNEGIESLNIVQNGGIIDINAKDDGVNVSDKRADSESESTDAGNEAAADNKDMQPKGGMMPEGTDGQMQQKAGRQMQPGSLSANAGPGGSMGKGGRGRMGGDPGNMENGNTDGNTEGGPGRMGGNMGGGGTFENIDGCIVINGGEITINAGGDGLDSNGDILIKGGTVRVFGPTGNGNSAVDKNGIWEQDGGRVYIQGSSGMLESVDTESSDEGFVSVIFDGNVNEGDEISLIDSDGNTVMSFTSQKSVPFVFFASEEIENGKEYTVRAGSLSQTVTAGQMSGSGMVPGMGFGGRGTDL